MFKSIRQYLVPIATVLFSASSISYAQTITFDEILSNPDDPALNLEYARQEIGLGRLQQAASALERLLLTKPNWDSVRLLYAVVLYRMDDLEGARAELYKLEGRDLAPTQEAERVRYLGLIEHATSPFRITGQVTFGARYDSNSGLVSDKIADIEVGFGFGDVEFPIEGAKDSEDFAFVGQGMIRLEADIPDAPGSLWFFQANGDLINFEDVNRADTASGTLKTGLALQQDRLRITPYVTAGRTWLNGEGFVERWGGGVSVNYELDPQLILFANGEFLDEDFDKTGFSPFNNQRDGSLVSGYVGALWRITESQSIAVTAFAADKNATNDGYSYEKRGISVNSLTLLGGGVYLSLTGRYTEVNFDQPDGNFGSPFFFETREDERWFARAAVGAPLQTLFGENSALPDFMEDVVVQVGVTWTQLSSTSNLIEYENISGDVLFTKKFSF